jgi:hypothetical protein
MAKRGRPKGAQSGPKAIVAWCAWGTPNGLAEKGYSSEGGARTKAQHEIEIMRKFGASFSKSFADQCAAMNVEVRDCAFSGATRDNPRQWTAVDDVSQVRFTIRLWTGK